MKIRIAIKTSDGKVSILRLVKSFAMTIYVRQEGIENKLKDEHLEIHGHVAADGRVSVRASKRLTNGMFDTSNVLFIENGKAETTVYEPPKVDGRNRRRKRESGTRGI